MEMGSADGLLSIISLWRYTENTIKSVQGGPINLKWLKYNKSLNVGILNQSTSKSWPAAGSFQTCSLSFAYRVGVAFGSAAKTATKITASSKALDANDSGITHLYIVVHCWSSSFITASMSQDPWGALWTV